MAAARLSEPEAYACPIAVAELPVIVLALRPTAVEKSAAALATYPIAKAPTPLALA